MGAALVAGTAVVVVGLGDPPESVLFAQAAAPPISSTAPTTVAMARTVDRIGAQDFMETLES
ncbi:hypothetical protein GFY24_32050 [Nocardia sp. SYP-A9097]|uniref:hypothetical protein n=1 Tax=Nocardia sp. SYP-A9097 TaxID=2663237 RepID=UPI00129A1250|nr:hypothetical protein [Nocardia sp. SYP-A9097]MRH92018.1 hypothetical protein [Nocardia sp. SYP-A9097]